jgi:phage baseplate assembly protein W
MNIYGETINIDSPTFRRLRDDRQILVQSIRMRLSTAPGTYFTDPEYGLPLEELLFEGLTTASVARLGARIAAEIEKDEERIESASVVATTIPSGASSKLVFAASVTPIDIPPFSLTISIQDLTIEVLLRGT